MVDEESFAKIEELLKQLNSILPGYKLAWVDTDQIDFLEKNARYMTHETFKNLSENIKRDGALSSVPFCIREGDRYRALSGNHRVKAAIASGLNKILTLYTDEPLTKQEQIAIQLSHNALTGQDDQVILKELWDEIEDLNLKYYAGLDDKLLDELKKINLETLAEVKLDFRTVTFAMLPEETERLDDVFKMIIDIVSTKEIYLAKLSDYDRLLDAMAKTQASYNIKNAATSLMLILDIFENHQTDLADDWETAESGNKSWIPLSSILGTDKVPIGAAKVIKKAVELMQSRGEVAKKNLWQALEFMSAEYLSG